MHSTVVLLPGEEPCELELPSFPRDPRPQWQWDHGVALARGCCTSLSCWWGHWHMAGFAFPQHSASTERSYGKPKATMIAQTFFFFFPSPFNFLGISPIF